MEYGTRLGHGEGKGEGTHNLSFSETQEYSFSWREHCLVLCLRHVSGATQV